MTKRKTDRDKQGFTKHYTENERLCDTNFTKDWATQTLLKIECHAPY